MDQNIVCYQYIFYPVPRYGSDYMPKVVFENGKISGMFGHFPDAVVTGAGIYEPIAAWRIKSK